MATYAFETMTPAEALAITAADAIFFPSVAANQVTVLYNLSGTISIVAAGRTLEFGSALASLGASGRLVLPGDARLFVGDATANTVSAPGQLAVSDGLYGGGGDDSMNGGLGDDLLQGNTGGDYLVGGGGRDVLYGGQDNDRIVTTVEIDDGTPFPAADGGDFAQGNRGDDVIVGGLGSDTLLGGQGSDTISGLSGGADFLNGNLGDDRVEGVGVLLGEDGADTLVGQGAADSLLGGDAADRITLLAGSADGGLGNDTIEVIGGAGRAVVLGGDGSDTLVARVARAEVQLSGGEGQDSLVGSSGVDTLSGDAGNDVIEGFGGRDVVAGGAGQDRFVARSGVIETPAELMRIVDWEADDRIDFADDGFTFASSSNYREITANTYDDAFAAASALRTTPDVLYVAVQVGADVVLFGLGPASSAALLTGRTLADIAFNNIV